MDKVLQTIVIDWIPNKAKVVDFGCGDGALLKILAEEKSILGYGVENDPVKINGCIDNGVSVICLLYTSPSPRDRTRSRMPSSA